MLPIRRIAGQLDELRWAQVFVELVLLVLGILIALAVNDWIEDRRDARLERQYLEFLVRDLESEQTQLGEHAAFEEKQTQDGVMALRALRGEHDAADPEEASRAMSRITARRTLRLPRSTYQDLLSTGSLRLIRNAELRDQIIRHYGTGATTEAIVDRNNQQFIDQMYFVSGVDSGLIAPPLDGNNLAISAAMEELARRVGGRSTTLRQELWTRPVGDPARTLLADRVWVRTMVSLIHVKLLSSLGDDSKALRRAIADELESR